MGKKLAEESPCTADIVMSIPDSANTAALGYAQRSGLRFEIGLIRNHYIGRTFIDPYQDKRDRDVRIKFNPVNGVLEGKRVVVVDDSIVRGTTMRQLVRLIREGGATEVHVRVASPPVRCPCFYGIDIPTNEELIASAHSVEEICRYMEADSLAYLSVREMLEAVPDGDDSVHRLLHRRISDGGPGRFQQGAIFDHTIRETVSRIHGAPRDGGGASR